MQFNAILLRRERPHFVCHFTSLYYVHRFRSFNHLIRIPIGHQLPLGASCHVLVKYQNQWIHQKANLQFHQAPQNYRSAPGNSFPVDPWVNRSVDAKQQACHNGTGGNAQHMHGYISMDRAEILNDTHGIKYLPNRDGQNKMITCICGIPVFP